MILYTDYLKSAEMLELLGFIRGRILKLAGNWLSYECCFFVDASWDHGVYATVEYASCHSVNCVSATVKYGSICYCTV